MESPVETPVPIAIYKNHPVNQVTCLSKYLAKGLFIIVPFLGGYIGYVYGLEKVVVVERVVVEDNIKLDTSVKSVSGVTETQNSFLAELGPEAKMDFLYRSTKTGFTYFNLITNSSVPSGIVRYEPDTKKFNRTDFYIDFFVSETPSPGGRYIAKLDQYNSPTTSIYVIDLEYESKLSLSPEQVRKPSGRVSAGTLALLLLFLG